MSLIKELSFVVVRKLSDVSISFLLFSMAASCAVRISFVVGGMMEPTGAATTSSGGASGVDFCGATKVLFDANVGGPETVGASKVNLAGAKLKAAGAVGAGTGVAEGVDPTSPPFVGAGLPNMPLPGPGKDTADVSNAWVPKPPGAVAGTPDGGVPKAGAWIPRPPLVPNPLEGIEVSVLLKPLDTPGAGEGAPKAGEAPVAGSGAQKLRILLT